MQNILKEKLWAYIVHSNPDLMFDLQESYSVTQYLDEKITGILPKASELLSQGKSYHAVIEICLDLLTEELKPSRFLFVRSIFREEFPKEYRAFAKEGETTFETLQIMEAAKELFETFGFDSETIKDLRLRHALIVIIHDYLL